MKKTYPLFFDSKANVFFALVIPVIVIYSKSLNYGFTSMDEQWMIVNDSVFLNDWINIKTAFTNASTDFYYRPFFVISLIVDYHLAKLNPFFYHFTNLFWHIISTILLYKFLVLYKVEKKHAYFISILFSIHPVLLHAVAWVPGRNDIMLCVFMLASLIHLKKHTQLNKKKHFFFHLLFFVCALFTKESAIVLPILFLILYTNFNKDALKKTLMVSFIWAALSILWLLVRHSVTSASISTANNLTTNLLNFVQGYILYIGKTLFPLQQSTLPSVTNTSLVPGLITFFILTFLCFKPGLNNRKTAFFGLSIFFVLLAIPVWFGATKSGSEHYEQRIYGSMIGIVLFLSQVKFKAESKLYAICIGVFCLSYCIKTYKRMEIYRNELSYIDAGIKERPEYYLFHLQKADILLKKGDPQASLSYFNTAITLRPNHAQALSNRGSCYFKLGNFKEAVTDYTKAIENSEFNKSYYINRCQAYFKNNEIEKAMHDFGILKKCCPEVIKTDFEKKLMEKWLQLLAGIQKEIEKNPLEASLYFKYASLYFGVELVPQGIALLKKAIELDPENKSYHDLLEKYAHI
jgi:protein O-mannosyl-transferase